MLIEDKIKSFLLDKQNKKSDKNRIQQGATRLSPLFMLENQ
jgi:hypothetical protein